MKTPIRLRKTWILRGNSNCGGFAHTRNIAKLLISPGTVYRGFLISAQLEWPECAQYVDINMISRVIQRFYLEIEELLIHQPAADPVSTGIPNAA